MRGIEQVPWLYDAYMAVVDRFGMGRWREWLARGARGRTLEVGCGTGRNLPRYGRERPVVGVDPLLESLLRARRRAPGVPLVVARAEALPFRSQSFDAVVSSLVFCSVDDPRAGLAEVRRVLAPGGALRMLEHVRAPGLRGRLQDWAQPAWTTLAGGCRPNRETERTVEEAGFRIDPEGRLSHGTIRRFQARADG